MPVDYVADALVALMHADGLDGQTFHLTAEKTIGLRGIYRGVAKAAGLPPLRGSLPGAVAAPVLKVRGRARVVRDMAATQLGIPAQVFDLVDLAPTFVSEKTRNALAGTGIEVPEFAGYAPRLWRYWAEHLDPDRARRDDPRGPLYGRHVIVTGASSGIGRASAIAIAQRAPPCSRSPATAPHWTRWSTRSAPMAVRPMPLPVTSPIPRRWNTPSRTSWAGSTTSITW